MSLLTEKGRCISAERTQAEVQGQIKEILVDVLHLDNNALFNKIKTAAKVMGTRVIEDFTEELQTSYVWVLWMMVAIGNVAERCSKADCMKSNVHKSGVRVLQKTRRPHHRRMSLDADLKWIRIGGWKRSGPNLMQSDIELNEKILKIRASAKSPRTEGARKRIFYRHGLEH